jgi:hypothetical protein
MDAITALASWPKSIDEIANAVTDPDSRGQWRKSVRLPVRLAMAMHVSLETGAERISD